MMKKLSIFLVIMTLVTLPRVFAQDSQKSASPSALVDEEKIKVLKDKLATKVAELRENQMRGFLGEIAALSKTSFTLITANGEVKVRYSDDTKLFKKENKKTVIEAKDLTNTQNVAVVGLFDNTSGQHTAKLILVQPHPRYAQGEIVEVNKKDGMFTIKTNQGEALIFEYEKTTTAQEYDAQNQKLNKSGMSRLTSQDKIHIWYTPSEDDNQKMKAVNILRLPKDMFAKADSQAPPPTTSPTTSPKTSPKATPKASPKASPTS